MNVIGEPVDYCGPISACFRLPSDRTRRSDSRGAVRDAETNSFLPIHRDAPPFSEQSTELEILVTGIKARPLPADAAAVQQTRTGCGDTPARRSCCAPAGQLQRAFSVSQLLHYTHKQVG
jgi:hypothetical protein